MSRRLPETNPSARPNRYRFSKYKKTLVLLTMAAPTAIWLLLLRYLPMGGIILAFKEYKVNPRNPSFISNLINSKWVGLNNFNFLFMTDDAKIMFRNTLLYNIVFIILGIIIPVAFAIMLNEVTKKFVAKAYQTMMFFPYFLSWVVVSYFLNAFIDGQYGMITAMQRAAGGEMTNWYTTLGPWPYIIVFANLWKNVGYTTVLYLSAITGIDSTQYEAAAIDGANRWQRLWNVTIPNMMPSITICTFLTLTNGFKLFDQNLSLTAGEPMKQTEMLALNIFNTFYGRVGWQGVGQAKAVLFFILVVGLGILQLKMTRSKEVQQ